MIVWWWIVAAVSSPCEHGVSRSALRQTADQVWQAFRDADPAALEASRERLSTQLPCVRERLTPLEAASLHRARAAEAFADEDTEAVRRSLGALASLDPRWTLPAHFGPRHPMTTLRRQGIKQADGSERVLLDWSPRGRWWLDGMPGRGEVLSLPTARSFVLQIQGEEGGWLHVGHHVGPASVPIAGLVPVRDRPEVRAARRRRIRLATGIAGGVVAASGVALWASGMADVGAERSEEDSSKAAARANRRRGAGYGLFGAGVLTLGLGLAVPW